MRLTFVHGRSQGDRSEAAIMAEWTAGLAAGLRSIGHDPVSAEVVSAPFYGAKLDELTAASRSSAYDVVFRGDQAGEDLAGLDPFEVEFLQEVARRAGVTDADIESEMPAGVRDRAPWNWEWVQAIARALDRRTPWLANVAMYTITKDVRTYLLDLRVRTAVHDIVQPPLAAEPTVVVAHSLGSIVAYWVLHDLGAAASVPLLVTAGSPLGIHSVKKRLPRPLGMPSGVAEWLNVSDPRDPVALQADLGGDSFPAPISNIGDVANPTDNPHGLAGYLADARVAERIAAAMTR